MNKLNFSNSAWTGLITAVLGSGGLTVLAVLLPELTALKIVMSLVAGLYATYIMACSEAKVGRLLTPVAWLVVTAITFHTTNLMAFAVIQVGFIWLVRCLYFHVGIVAAVIDAVLSMCSVGVGIWALASSNWMLALWSFFLVQSLAVWIPQTGTGKNQISRPEHDFAQASANANAALKKLTSSLN